MNQLKIINELERNRSTFKNLFNGIDADFYLWRQVAKKWNLLEIICHLYDEERDDFRARTKAILDQTDGPLPAIDPVGWVKSRNYADQDYNQKLQQFLSERDQSIDWLKSQLNSNWNLAKDHPEYGSMTASQFLANWLAHDYLHMRQILKVKFAYLRQRSGQELNYAGPW